MFSFIKRFIYKPVGVYRTYCYARSKHSLNRKRLFLLNIPSHGNLGDHLLSVVEQQFLADNFPDKEVVLVPSAALYYSIRIALMDVRKDDILCITGGGFMGSLYEEEERILTIMKRFSDNKIIFFPQTIYYEFTNKREKQIDKAAKIYSAHKKLYVTTRDSTSYQLLRTRLMPEAVNRMFLMPDIALYAHFPQVNPRKGVLWCLRQDAEINEINAPVIQQIKKKINERHLDESYTDTYVFRSISIEAGNREVRSKVEEISRARLVITDRLHGMIYSLITDTPVIALDNINRKVSQVYNLWLKDVPFVKVIDENSDIDSVLESMLNQSDCHYDNNMIRKKFQPIIDVINE